MSGCPAPPRGVCTEIFSTFLFFASRGGVAGGGRAAGGCGLQAAARLRPPLMLSQCFLSLFLELHSGTRPSPGPSHAGGPAGRRQAVQPGPLGGGARKPAHRPPRHRLLLPALRGLSVWGEGSCVETVPHPRPHPRNAAAATAAATATVAAHGGPRRPSRELAGRAASSQVVLSCLRVPLPRPNVSSDFSLPSLPPSLGSAQVKRLPPLHGSPLTSCFLLFLYVCVDFSCFFFSLPFLLALPPSSAM